MAADAKTGRRVDVVAESEGTLGVARDARLAPHVPLAAVVLLSPIVAPGQVTYPVGDGSAEVPGSELQGVVWFVGGLSPFGTSGAQALIGSVNQVGARFRGAGGPPSPAALDGAGPAGRRGHPAHLQPARQRAGGAGAARQPARRPGSAGDGPRLPDPPPGRPHRGLRTTAQIVAAAASAWRIPLATTPSPPCPR